MIKKSRARFILATMLIVFFIFFVFFYGFYRNNKNMQTVFFEQILDNEITSARLHRNDKNVLVNADAIYVNENLIINENSNISEEICRELFQKAWSTGLTGMANDDVYYYKLYEGNSLSIFIIKDMTNELNLFKQKSIQSIVTIASIYGCIFVFVYLLSFKVFEPVEKMLEKQKRFISDASHELKTPITIISANVDVLKSNDDNQWLQNIKGQTERLDSLVADMLSLAKFDEKKAELKEEDLDLTALAYETLLPFDAVAFEQDKKINLDIAQNVTARGDVTSVKKIMTILMDNAVKYSIKFSEIQVVLLKEKNVVKFSVKNAGSSVKEEDSNKVFERFYRGANSRNRDSGGSGLGLSIAKSIADNNGWKLFADSHYGESMEITLYIKTK